MFKKLEREAIITYKLRTESPLYIKAGEDNSLNPSAVDGTYMKIYRNGTTEPFIPGTSIKGVFRSRAERMLKDGDNGSCDIIDRKECVTEKDAKKNKYDGTKRYELSCPVCKLFGSKVLRSRVVFSDLYVNGQYKVGSRTCVGIDRITGAAKKGALYDIEYIEDAEFDGKITLQNFEPYQVRLLLELFEELNEGFITLGGLSSKGFGVVKAYDFKIKLKEYSKETPAGYKSKGLYKEKMVVGFENIANLVQDVDMSKLRRGGKANGKAL